SVCCCFTAARSFFFSSRRRHTRFSRDWSSDVCSSDLTSPYGHFSLAVQKVAFAYERLPDSNSPPPALLFSSVAVWAGLPNCPRRSEERRVGKESTARCKTRQEKKDIQLNLTDLLTNAL